MRQQSSPLRRRQRAARQLQPRVYVLHMRSRWQPLLRRLDNGWWQQVENRQRIGVLAGHVHRQQICHFVLSGLFVHSHFLEDPLVQHNVRQVRAGQQVFQLLAVRVPLVQLFIQRVVHLLHVHRNRVNAQLGRLAGYRRNPMVGRQRHPHILQANRLVQPRIEAVQIPIERENHLLFGVRIGTELVPLNIVGRE